MKTIPQNPLHGLVSLDELAGLLAGTAGNSTLKHVGIAEARGSFTACVEDARNGAIVQITNAKRPGLVNVVLISTDNLVQLASRPEPRSRTLDEVLRDYPYSNLRGQRVIAQAADDDAPSLRLPVAAQVAEGAV